MNVSLIYKSASAAILTVFFLWMGLAGPAHAQELDCTVSIEKSKVNNASLSYLDELGPAIEAYLNQRDWVDDHFEERERIKCTMQIILNSVDDNYNFEASLVLSTLRPIYGTMQETQVLLLSDNSWVFNYPPNKSLTHDELQFDNLTSFLDFYAYIILGYDYDTFSALGGTPYFSKAQNLLDLAQTTSAAGWTRSSSNRRNRYYLITDLLSANYEGLRRAEYQYHRLGLDPFTSNPEKARNEVLKALETIQKTKRRSTNDYLFDLFFSAKYKEITALFEGGDTQTRIKAYNLLSNIDNGHITEYEKLRQ